MRNQEADRIVMDVMATRQFGFTGTTYPTPIYTLTNPDSEGIPTPIRASVAWPTDNQGIDVAAIHTRLVELLKEKLPDSTVEVQEIPLIDGAVGTGIRITWS